MPQMAINEADLNQKRELALATFTEVSHIRDKDCHRCRFRVVVGEDDSYGAEIKCAVLGGPVKFWSVCGVFENRPRPA